jgi:parallel beta-helix repeat protein
MSGTYVLNHYVTLKDSDQFICVNRRTCVLTGLDQYRGALTAAFGSSHQVIRGFVAEHFISVDGAWPNAALQLRDNGLIDDNEVRFNKHGISVSSNQTISSNYIHDNGQYGIGGGPLSNLIIENNVLSSNNTLHLDPNDNAGGSKIIGGTAGSNFVTWRNNHVHDNWGQGIWTDGNVRNTLIEGNLVENNWGAGIDHEISWDATIRGNVVRGNMRFELDQRLSCWHGAQIVVTNSQNLNITGNTIEGVGTNSICLSNTTRTEASVFPQSLANVSVSANVIKLTGVAYIGVVGDRAPSGISFSGNSYYVDVLTNTDWNFNANNPMTWQQWRAAGQDTSGSLFPVANWTGSSGGTTTGGTTTGGTTTGGTTTGGSTTGGTTTGGTTGGTGGSLTGSGVASFAAVNLTTTGTADWAKWPNYIRKASGGSKISDFSKLGPALLSTYAQRHQRGYHSVCRERFPTRCARGYEYA